MTGRLLRRPLLTLFARFILSITVLWVVGLLVARGVGTLMPDQGHVFFGSWFLSEEEYYIVDLERSLQMNVSQFPTCCYNWSPDRMHRLVIDADTYDGGLDIYITDAQGENRRKLTDTTGAINTYPAWSPDNQHIAYISTRGANPEIYVMDTLTGEEQRLTFGALPEGPPAWSPDGTHIAFVSAREVLRSIWIVEADGDNLHRLPTTTQEANAPAWSPDGQQIAYSTGSYMSSDIYVINADGSGERQLTHFSQAEAAWYPIWSGDGSLIVFLWRMGMERDIFVMNGDGSNLHRLTNNRMSEDYIVWME